MTLRTRARSSAGSVARTVVALERVGDDIGPGGDGEAAVGVVGLPAVLALQAAAASATPPSTAHQRRATRMCRPCAESSRPTVSVSGRDHARDAGSGEAGDAEAQQVDHLVLVPTAVLAPPLLPELGERARAFAAGVVLGDLAQPLPNDLLDAQ